RLRDADDERAVGEDRVAVAELRGDLDLHRDARPTLDGVAGDHAGVQRGPAREDADRAEAGELRVAQAELGQPDPAVDEPALERAGDGRGLLVDLLEHVRREPAAVGRLPGDVERLRLALHGGARRVEDLDALGAHRDELAEAMNCSPSPAPITSGASRRAPTSRPGSSALIATNAKWPWSWA